MNTGNTAQEVILIDASPSEVFAALTQSEQVVTWWGDESGYRMTDVKHELKPGGAVRYSGLLANGAEFHGVGTNRFAHAPHVLEYTRRYTNGFPCAEETTIRYEIVERNGKTELCVTHTGFESEAMSKAHSDGWFKVLTFLRAYMNKK